VLQINVTIILGTVHCLEFRQEKRFKNTSIYTVREPLSLRCDSSDGTVIRPRARRPKNRGFIHRRHNRLISSPKRPERLAPIERVAGALSRRCDWEVRLTSNMYLWSRLRKRAAVSSLLPYAGMKREFTFARLFNLLKPTGYVMHQQA
jgi:hypothetical protein